MPFRAVSELLESIGLFQFPEETARSLRISWETRGLSTQIMLSFSVRWDRGSQRMLFRVVPELPESIGFFQFPEETARVLRIL